MVRDELSVLSAFLAVAEERSFTRAAKRIGVTQSALSHAKRGLEEQIGVRLLARTTRSVAPMEAGKEFDKGKQSLTVAVNGPLTVDDVEIMVRAAIDGVGLAFMSEDRAAPHLASGELVRVLEEWCPPFPGFFLYYPRQRQLSAALAALIETLRLGGVPHRAARG